MAVFSGVVAQTFPSSPEIIYSTLTSDETFMSLVGTYTFVGGVTQDSITILTPGQSLPQLESTTGLEVVIHDVGVTRRRDYLTGYSDPVTTWKVYLIAWPGSNGATLNTAIQRMIRRFSGATTLEISTAGAALGALTQSLVLVPSSGGIFVG